MTRRVFGKRSKKSKESKKNKKSEQSEVQTGDNVPSTSTAGPLPTFLTNRTATYKNPSYVRNSSEDTLETDRTNSTTESVQTGRVLNVSPISNVERPERLAGKERVDISSLGSASLDSPANIEKNTPNSLAAVTSLDKKIFADDSDLEISKLVAELTASLANTDVENSQVLPTQDDTNLQPIVPKLNFPSDIQDYDPLNPTIRDSPSETNSPKTDNKQFSVTTCDFIDSEGPYTQETPKLDDEATLQQASTSDEKLPSTPPPQVAVKKHSMGISNPSYVPNSSEEVSQNEEITEQVTSESTERRFCIGGNEVTDCSSIGSGNSLAEDSPECSPRKKTPDSLDAVTSLNAKFFSSDEEQDGPEGPSSQPAVIRYMRIGDENFLDDLTRYHYTRIQQALEKKDITVATLAEDLFQLKDNKTVGLVLVAAMSDLFSGITDSIRSTATAISRNEYVRKVTESMNDAIMNYPKAEMAVREATNEDPWGPTGPQMKKIAEYTKSRYMEDYYNVFTPLFSRMLENNKDAWRRVYKSLVLLDYLLKNGSERFVTEARDKSFELRRLESYKYTDEKGKDQGINIRHRVKLILEMLNDDDKLQAERKKANTDDKSKYRGYDQYDIKMSTSSSSSSFNNKKWEQNSAADFDSNDYKRDTREVSNFSFASNSTNNRSPSPELGFVDESSKKKIDEDDGFGDFVSSRSSQPAATNKSTPNPTKPNNFFDPVPVIPPPSASSASNYVAPPLSPVGNKAPSNFDLLGGFDTPAPVSAPAPAVQSNSFDLFSLAPVATSPTPAPTAAAAPMQDLFAFAPTSQNIAPAAPAAPTNGGFNGFDFGPSFGSSSSALGGMTPMQPAAPQVQTKQIDLSAGPAPKVGSSFAGLDQFMSLSLNSTNSSTPRAKTLNQMMGSNK